MNTHLGSTRFVSAENLERLTKWAGRKPVIALMGEFSAGKSTLLNMLIGRTLLPMQVTATRLPPVWARYGTGPSYRVDHAGTRHEVDLHNPASIPMADTRYVRIYHDSVMLKKCDIIDTPGISDPNIPLDVWIKTIAYANSVLWCTPANQAWRESERGTWESLPVRLRENSLLLVTRADKLLSDIDRDKIDRRLERETAKLFGHRHFISLTQALKSLEGQGDPETWVKSGAQGFMESFNQVIEATHRARQSHLSRYKIGQSRRPVMPARPATGVDGETKPVIALRPTRVVQSTDGEREPRFTQEDAQLVSTNLHPHVNQDDLTRETAAVPEEDADTNKPRSVFSLRRQDKQPDAAPPANDTGPGSGDHADAGAPKVDFGFRNHPDRGEDEKPADEAKAEDAAMGGEDVQAGDAKPSYDEMAKADVQADEITADTDAIADGPAPVEDASSEAEPLAADDEFHEDEFSEPPGPEEVSSVIARIDAAIPAETNADAERNLPDAPSGVEGDDESKVQRHSRTASEIWGGILKDEEIETVAQMKEAISRLVAELDENAALLGDSELAQALG